MPRSHPPLGTALQEAAAAAGRGACGPTWPHPPCPHTQAMTDTPELHCSAWPLAVSAVVQAEWVSTASAMRVKFGMLGEWLQAGPADWGPMLSVVQVILRMAAGWLQGCDAGRAAEKRAVSWPTLHLQGTRLQGSVVIEPQEAKIMVLICWVIATMVTKAMHLCVNTKHQAALRNPVYDYNTRLRGRGLWLM